jgi:thiol-disulfide isomerase/thioredoxin
VSRPRLCPPGRSRPAAIRHRITAPRRAAAAALVAAATLALTACGIGPIAQNTPASNGQDFVAGTAGVTVFGHGSPAAPRVSGTTLAGAPLSLGQFRGHVVVLNFWGSWCTPCRAEAPVLAALSQHFAPSGVRFLGVDIRDTPATAEAFQRDFRITYPSLNDPGDQIAVDFASTVPPAGIPTTLVISRSGRIAARVIGGVSYRGLRSLITATLAQRS